MPVRILHTADNHIGISFQRFPDEVRDQLVDERFSALKRLVEAANARHAHFFTVGGDLFDKVTVRATDVERTVDILRDFEGEAVLVVAGNHDYCEGPDSKLWKAFRRYAEGSDVYALTEQRTHDFAVDDSSVRFYACPCPSKHGTEHRINWVAAEDKQQSVLHIGLAHGNVEGQGLDADHRYFNMTEQELRAAGMDTWLLGHIHVPAPPPGTTGRPLYFMPGVHTPNSIKCTHSGHAWWVELETDGSCDFLSVSEGAIRFARIDRALEHSGDIDALRQDSESFDAHQTVLHLQLSGRLKDDELAELITVVEELRSQFLHLEVEQDIAKVLHAESVARRFPDGTLPNALLLALLSDQSEPGDAYLALKLIENLHE